MYVCCPDLDMKVHGFYVHALDSFSHFRTHSFRLSWKLFTYKIPLPIPCIY